MESCEKTVRRSLWFSRKLGDFHSTTLSETINLNGRGRLYGNSVVRILFALLMTSHPTLRCVLWEGDVRSQVILWDTFCETALHTSQFPCAYRLKDPLRTIISPFGKHLCTSLFKMLDEFQKYGFCQYNIPLGSGYKLRTTEMNGYGNYCSSKFITNKTERT